LSCPLLYIKIELVFNMVTLWPTALLNWPISSRAPSHSVDALEIFYIDRCFFCE
jgi:hypothetical protein